ncbi:Siderophore-interacting protein [compost metagenome]
MKGLNLPAGQLYAWVALEKSLTRKTKRLLIDEKGVKEDLIKAAAYWRLDPHDDE